MAAMKYAPHRQLVIAALLVGVIAPAVRTEEPPPPKGVDVVEAAKHLTGVPPPAGTDVGKGKPWEDAIAGLTNPDAEVFRRAQATLIRHGAAVVPDLAVLAKDAEWMVRYRVVMVASAIPGEDSTRLVLALSRDRDQRVREVATLGLGQCRGAGIFERLQELLGEADPGIRQAAVRSLGRGGDVRAIALLCGYVREQDDLVARDQRAALEMAVLHPQATRELARLIAERQGAEQLALIEASGGVGDPRLCPTLVRLLGAADPLVAARSARALAANGDSRAVGPLCQAASAGATPELRNDAASALKQLTGYAAAGQAWELWWRDHAGEIGALVDRDRFLAELYDPARPVTRVELAAFTPDQLMPLIDGALGFGPPWWPARAYAVLAQDDPARWTQPLLRRIAETEVARHRLPLIILLDQLGDPKAEPGLRRLLEAKESKPEDLEKPQAVPQHEASAAERVALRIALERRQGKR